MLMILGSTQTITMKFRIPYYVDKEKFKKRS